MPSRQPTSQEAASSQMELGTGDECALLGSKGRQPTPHLELVAAGSNAKIRAVWPVVQIDCTTTVHSSSLPTRRLCLAARTHTEHPCFAQPHTMSRLPEAAPLPHLELVAAGGDAQIRASCPMV